MNTDNLNDVFLKFDVVNILNCSTVCKLWNNISKSENIWEFLFKEIFNNPINFNYRNQYKRYHKLNKFLAKHIKDDINKCILYDDLTFTENSSIIVLPKEISILINLTSLNINRTELRYIPSEIGLLINLITLYLTRNDLKTLPKEIGSLKNLEVLAFNDNYIKEIPEEFCQLIHLKALVCSTNYIEKLPENIGNLVELEELYLDENCLSKFPNGIEKLTNLLALNLSENLITEIPDNVNNMINLQRLYLDYCELKTLPVSLGDLTLDIIALGENPLQDIPLDIQLMANLTIKIDKNKFHLINNIHKCEFMEFRPIIKLVRDPLTQIVKQYIKVKVS